MGQSRVKLSTNDKVALIGNLSTMLTAGIPILEAVDSLAKDVKGNQKKDSRYTSRRSDTGEKSPYYPCQVSTGI